MRPVLVGDGYPVPCLDGSTRPYLNLDCAASTSALSGVAGRVAGMLPWYASVHGGAGYKSRRSVAAYEAARETIRDFAGRGGRDDVVILCRNTTEAINHLAYRLALRPDDVVVTTVVEHHANLLPWRRVAQCRYVECERDGRFSGDAVVAALDARPRPRLLAITGASNVTGWMPPLEPIIAAAHERGVRVFVDAAQLAPHAPLPRAADFVAFSGHKLYAPFGAGALIGPRAAFAEGDPFLAGGGAVELVDLDEVIWAPPPEREEAGSPNVIGAVALGEAARELDAIGWDAIRTHDRRLARRLVEGIGGVPGVRILGPSPRVERLPVVSFTVADVPHALVAARLSFEFGIGVRDGCFCAHPYVTRLLGIDADGRARARAAALRGKRGALPGAVRASAGLSTALQDVDRLVAALRAIVATAPPIRYEHDLVTGTCRPVGATAEAVTDAA